MAKVGGESPDPTLMQKNTRQILAAAARSALNPMGLEPLEDRRLMTAVAGPEAPISLGAHGTLRLTGSRTAANDVQVELVGNGQLRADVNGTTQTFAASAVKHIRVTGGAGADTVTLDSTLETPAVVVTGAGNDSIYGGAGHDVIHPGAGNDLVYTHGGDNIIYSGRGDDQIISSKGDRVIGDRIGDVQSGGLANGYLYAAQPAEPSLVGSAVVGSAVVGSAVGGAAVGGAAQQTSTATVTATPVAAPAPVVAKPVTVAPVVTAPVVTAPVVVAPVATTTVVAPVTTTPIVAKPVNEPVTTPTPTTTTTKATTPTPTSTAAPSGPQFVSVAGGSASADAAALQDMDTPGGTTANGKPVAILQLEPGPREVGLVVNVDGLSSFVGVGSATTTQYSWDFGDAHGAHDQLTGFNAAHVYDTAGTYTVSLTVTNSAGQTSVAKGQVTVAADTRHAIYVNADTGSDGNAGTAAAPLKTVAAALAEVKDHTEVMLQAGESFPVTGSMSVNNTDVVITRYGTGADPVLDRSPGGGASTIATYGNADGLTVEHLTFDDPAGAVGADGIAPKLGLGGMYLRGQNETVRDCTFLNVDDAVSEAGNPDGTLVEDNTAPDVTGLRGYMVWAQGDRGTIVGNTVANSTREHCIRMVTADEVTVEDNTLTNLDRTTVDSSDGSKGCIEMHMGAYAWISNNSVTDGDIRVGPRAAANEPSDSSTDDCVVQDNRLTDTFIFVMPGTHDTMIDNNEVTTSTGESAIVMNGTDAEGRESTGITFDHNTVVDNGNWGNFLKVQGAVTNVTLTNNLFIAPKLQIGFQTSAAVYVAGNDLSCFSRIADNVWPAATGSGGIVNGAAGAVNDVTGVGWVTAAQWSAYGQVSGDRLQDVTESDLADGTFQLYTGAEDVGADLARAA